MQKIASAFIKAKKAFSPALKDKTNPAFRSKYADLGACLEAVNDALLDNGIAVYQETHEDATGVTVETVLLHESGESIRSGKFHVPAAKQDPQGYGSALTYARRYSLMTACGIAPEDDDGNAGTDAKHKAEQFERRQKFLADAYAAIQGASNAGELKRIVAETTDKARSVGDQAGVDQINGWAEAKASKAKPKTQPQGEPA
jgi:hypothetical protein